MTTFVSLFSGIGGFDLAFERAGMTCLAQVEIDKAARNVLARHFPTVPRFEDVKDVGAHNLPHADVIAFGSPCQDLSIAGARKGLSGERSGLFFEAIRIIKELNPKFAIWENVPGAFSSNDGKDIIAALDALESAGYAVELNILDAQYFGVPQRRKRVFAVCQSADHLVQTRTISSAATISQCSSEILGSILAEARVQSLIVSQSWVSQKSRSADGLLRRMKLFNLTSLSAWNGLVNSLTDTLAKYPIGLQSLDARFKSELEEVVKTVTVTSAIPTQAGNEWFHGLISTLWSNIWDESWSNQNLSTISTALSQTTELKIFTCAAMSLITCLSTAPLISSYPTYWNEASSGLTVMKEFMSYAKQASRSLFTGMDWIQPYRAYLGCAEYVERLIERNLGTERRPEILPFTESGARDPESSREARKGTTPALSASTSSSRNGGSSPTAGHFISGTLAASGAGTMRPAGQKNELDFLIPTSEIAKTLTTNYGKQPDSSDSSTPGNFVIVNAEALDVRNLRSNGDISGTLQSKATGGYSLNYQNSVLTSSSTSNKRFFDEETQSWCVIDSDGVKRFIDPSFAPTGALAFRQRAFGDYSDDEIASAIKARDHKDATDLVVNAFNITFGDASGRRKDRPNGGLYVNETDKANTLDTNPSGEKTVIAFDYKASAARQQPVRQHKQSGTLSTTRQEGALIGQSVRRLTPVECERLQGFPDGWTDTPQPDSPRYKQLGNAVAVPVAEWIGQRIMAELQ